MKYVFLSCCCFLYFTVQSQTFGKVSGSVNSLKDGALPGATVLLLADSSDETIKAAFSDADGKFEFEQVKLRSARIAVQYIGYQKYISELFTIPKENLTIPTITLKESASELKELSVTARIPFAVKKLDRIIVNPAALISNAGLTALEVLEKAPLVSVDYDGNVSLRGKNGVLVLIDDRPSYLSEAELASYLSSIPASSIETIEVMTNPPAKYDASGNAGIINIKLKRNIAKGFNGGINLSYGQGRYHRTNNSLNFNYRIQKLNLFSNLSVNSNGNYQDLTIYRTYFTTSGDISSKFTQNSYRKSVNNGNNLQIGADFYANKKTTFGAVLSGFINPISKRQQNNAFVQDMDLQTVNLVEAQIPMDVLFKNGSTNLNMTHKINDKAGEISINVDNILYNTDISQSLINNIFAADRTFVSSSLLESSLPSDIKINSGKIDYSGLKLLGGNAEFGAKSSLVSTSNIADFKDVVDGIKSPNYQFSNDFSYRENINSLYMNYNRDFKKITLQAGLRMEKTNINGYQAGNVQVSDSSFHFKYSSLFPTFYLQYTDDTLQKHVFSLSMGRRIDRPNYKDLNPFIYPMDKFTFYGGNPFLQPTFSYNTELTHTYKSFLSTTLFYSHIDNSINETNEQRGNIYYSRPGNYAQQTSYGLSLNGTFTVQKWWTLILDAALSRDAFKTQIYTEYLNSYRWNWAVSSTNQFKINKKWNAELGGSYNAKSLSGQFLISPIGSVRAAISTKILKNKGALKLNVQDIFYTYQVEGQIRNIANAQASWFSYFDSRVVGLAFSYRFSKGDNLKLRQTGASDTEQRRVKS